MTTRQSLGDSSRNEKYWIALIGVLSVLSYLPILNNGFIADDFVKLNAVEMLKAHPGYLLATPPEMFRTTGDIVFILLKTCFGYRSEFYYAFSIALHCVNCLLLRRLLKQFPLLEPSANIAAVCFAVFQAPQEAVMWLAAISDPIVTAFILATLILWVRKQYLGSLVFYSLALVSKESAVVVLALVPIAEYLRGQKLPVRRYLTLWIPSLAFGAAFFLTWQNNYLITSKQYAAGFGVFMVTLRTIVRLAWPWLLILIALLRLDLKQWISLRSLAAVVALLCLGVSPYVFLVYQGELPSRSVYIASTILMSTIAWMLMMLKRPAFRYGFIAVFVAFNVLYLWFRKDGQFEGRAAPTTQFIAELRERPAAPLFIRDYVYRESPETAYYATALVPGRQMWMVGIEGWDEKCNGCTVLRWNPASRHYDEEK